MYRVTMITDGLEYLLHDPRDEELQLLTPVLTLEMGKNGEFVFRISPLHPFKNRIRPLKSEIRVFDDDNMLFCGRPISEESDFYNVSKIICEGELAFMVDSIQRPYNFTGSLADFIGQLISVHNSQVEAKKQFEVGMITVTDSVTERSCSECKTTMQTIRQQLTAVSDGYLRLRYVNDKKYVDYIWDYGGINDQAIRFGDNLLDLSRFVKPVSIITALVPYGATVDSEDTEEEPVTVDITSVNGGKDYIIDQDAVDTYGLVWGSKKFDGVTDPEALLQKASAYLQECVTLPVTLELTAVDLGLIDVDIKKMQVGYWTQVESVPHGISRRFILTKKQFNLDAPGKDRILLGQTLPAFVESTNKNQIEISDRINRVATSASKEINRKVENATQLITGGRGGYVVLDVYDPDTGKKMHPWRILIMNTPDKETATNVIQINQNGIGFSTTGINGPYANAWTIDGNLVADFITAGTMLADRIRGGILELGGTGLGKDGAITVQDADGKTIGSWNKDGLSVLKGILQGVSAIFGGVDNQDGAITVRDADGKTIGSWDKTGLSVLRGILQGVSAVFGGADNQDGAIEVRDASGQKIGRWDKDGLNVELGEISGSTIRGSKIIGGTINIGGGTFHVDEGGAVVIESGEISLGPVYICENYIDIGAFRASDAKNGAFFSANDEIWITTSDWFDENPGIEIKKGGIRTRIGHGGISTGRISLDALRDEYGPQWEDVSYNIIELWNRLIALENSMENTLSKNERSY